MGIEPGHVEEALPIVDLTDYAFRTDTNYFNSTQDRLFVKKEMQGKEIKFIYLTKNKELVGKYLKTYHGVTLDQTS